MSASNGDLGATSLAYVESLYATYLEDPSAVPEAWRSYFAAEEREGGATRRVGPSFRPRSIFNPLSERQGEFARQDRAAFLQDRLDQLMRAYRVRGHIAAKVNPLGGPATGALEAPELDPAFYGFTEEDMERRFSADTIPGPDVLTLREILDHLRETYCRSIGVQFMHIDRLDIRGWLGRRMELTQNRCQLDHDEQVRIFTRLTDAVLFEEFIRKKYIGAKSFSLEGAETLVPLLALAIEKAASQGVEEIVLGMAHRGRLNVLANIMGKNPGQIFLEFEDNDPDRFLGRGDVKYHLGYESVWKAAGGREVNMHLCFNPSHLEFVNPVAVGLTRAFQDRMGDSTRQRAMSIQIHGDAAFIGEGIVQETLNMSQIPSARTGGTLHIIVNNQIGFTTPHEQSRSSPYASDIAKMLQIPVFHVNGEDPEAVAQVVRLALDFREEFHRDVVIDMYCYRRQGHNENDEPSFTQPLMYKAIRARKKVHDAYLEHLQASGELDSETADSITEERRDRLERELADAREGRLQRASIQDPDRKPWNGGPVSRAKQVDTGYDAERLSSILETMSRMPAEFHLHKKLTRFFNGRIEMARGSRPLDWGAGEALAFATLALDGVPVRLNGQDSGRGTFTHRHAILHDSETGDTHIPLQHLDEAQAPVEIYNSCLSEAGALGFEYGYTLGRREGLTIWEAQFGDFVNVAQVIIDQFISSAEDKWDQLSNLVMLLPHGFEGQGPEHSSARLERFLNLCAEDNMQVVVPSTPAQCFHMLRRQVKREWVKPLIVMSPKSLLRHPQAVSTIEDLATGRFMEIIDDREVNPQTTEVEKILLCSGKVYYDLLAAREEREITTVPILRLEQLYPLPMEELEEILGAYPSEAPVVWVQDEPENMGAWWHLRVRFLNEMFGHRLEVVCREASASPATGSHRAHEQEQARLMDEAFAAVKSGAVASGKRESV